MHSSFATFSRPLFLFTYTLTRGEASLDPFPRSFASHVDRMALAPNSRLLSEAGENGDIITSHKDLMSTSYSLFSILSSLLSLTR